jgi:hypothetical protein
LRKKIFFDEAKTRAQMLPDEKAKTKEEIANLKVQLQESIERRNKLLEEAQ